MNGQQWLRSASLVVARGDDAIAQILAGGGEGLDLSAMHIKFRIVQSDFESPNNAIFRVYNLSDSTVKQIIGRAPVEFTRVVFQAGYQDGAGIIFDGTIKQFKRGKENATDTYLDILAAENDIEYNFGVCNATVAAGSTSGQRADVIAKSAGLSLGDTSGFSTGGTLPRGKVLFGMARALMRCEARTNGSSWNIQGGKVNVIPLDGYLPGEAVVLNQMSGLIGIPEQTEQGIKARCLLNPKLRIGGLFQIDNASVTQTSQADLRASGFADSTLPAGQLPFDRYAGVQMLADVSNDGFYRAYVVEYVGDTRGNDWYSDIIGLSIDSSTNKVIAK